MGSEESEALGSASVASAPHLMAFSPQPHMQKLRKEENGREPRLTMEAAPPPADSPRAAASGDVQKLHPLISLSPLYPALQSGCPRPSHHTERCSWNPGRCSSEKRMMTVGPGDSGAGGPGSPLAGSLLSPSSAPSSSKSPSKE